MEITTQIHINASPERVWQVLTGFEQYPSWNPFIHNIDGHPEEGATLRVKINPPDGMAMLFRPVVLTFAENRELRWLGRLLFKGLLDGEHYFILEESMDGTLFIHGEKFSGLLSGIFAKTLQKTEDGFHAMNQALKTRCESAE